MEKEAIEENKTDDKEVELSKKTVAELKAMAKEAKIEGYSKLKKEELIAVLKK